IRTSNGGLSWSTYEVYPITLTDIFFTSKTTGWTIANEQQSPYPTVFKSTNSGINWFPQTVIGYERKPMLSIFMNDSNKGWIGLDSGKVAKTTDGGINWNVINFRS